MNHPYSHVYQQLNTLPGANSLEVEKLLAYAGENLPSDYPEFLRRTNGAVGTGPNLFVSLGSAEDVISSTEIYGAPEYGPGLLLIGSDGCGNLLGIDLRSTAGAEARYVWFDPMDIDGDTLQLRASTLMGLLSELDTYFSRLSDAEINLLGL